jgi:hypothetical protein
VFDVGSVRARDLVGCRVSSILVRVRFQPGERAATGFVDYVHEVARGLGVCANGDMEGVEVEFESLASAYIPLPRCAPNFPAYDLALVWDEESGWAVAIEADPGYPPIAIAYHGGGVLPVPSVVVSFVEDLLAGRQPGQPNRPTFRCATDEDDLLARLAHYCPRG